MAAAQVAHFVLPLSHKPTQWQNKKSHFSQRFIPFRSEISVSVSLLCILLQWNNIYLQLLKFRQPNKNKK